MRILYLPNNYSQQRQHEKRANIYPVLLAMQAEFYRKQGHEVIWGRPDREYNFVWKHCDEGFGEYLENPYDRKITEPENLPFLSLPHPDRVFTRAKKYTSGNYKYLPGTHIMSASGCWHGKCAFCMENGKPYEVRPVEDVISEIEECKALGFKEVFDDSATFPTGRWLDEFISAIHNNGIHIPIGCNCRITNVYPFLDMFNAGFRMCLFGIESANQYTLDRINKGVKIEDIIPTIKRASQCGLDCHGAFMFGYPWETREDAERTLRLCHHLLRKGYLKTAQASLYCPQGMPGNQAHQKFIKKIYNAGFYPDFWWNKIFSIRDSADLSYLWRGIKSWIR